MCEGLNAWKLWEVEVLCEVCLSFVSTGICGRERGAYVEENGPASRLIKEWEEDFVGLYILLSLPLASLVGSVVECGRERERASS